MFYFYENTKDGLILKQLTYIFLNFQKIENKDGNVSLALTTLMLCAALVCFPDEFGKFMANSIFIHPYAQTFFNW